jgi:hypothetical protein
MSPPPSKPSAPPPRPAHLPPKAAEAADAEPGEQGSIGSAHMRADGTLELRLRAEAPGGIHGEALFIVSPHDPRYADLVQHLGGIQPGGYAGVAPLRHGLL